MKLQIEYVPIETLREYENNAKEHPKDQIEQIKKSIQEFGMNDPIAVWKDNVIIEGHGRLIACRDLGITEVPVIRLDSLTDEQRRAYGLVHNKLTMNSDFDAALLETELEGITDIDMEEFGFLIEETEKAIKERPEVEFVEVLGEQHDYIVLYFDNEVDWLQAETLFGLKTGKCLSTRKDGVVKPNMERKGIGRVLRGREALERMREQFADLH